MKISVLGCGRWGSFITWYLAREKHEVIEWGRENGKSFTQLKQHGENDYVKLDKSVCLTSDLKYAVENSELVIISVLSQSLREVVFEGIKYGLKDKKVLLCMKGIEIETNKRLTEVLMELGLDKNKIAVWLGPGHIQEFTQGKPNCMVIDSYNRDLTTYLADSLKSDLIRFYYGDDIIGNEIGGASKNVMGIAAGMLDGAGCSTLKGPLMARGAREVGRLIKAMGGNELSAYGLCHLGDYETTLFSSFSRNRKFGECFIKGEKFLKSAEGVDTCKALKSLSKKYNTEMPIVDAVYSILFENKSADEVFNKLFNRTTKKEF